MQARQWNRQFLGVEPTAEELAVDKADQELINTAKGAMVKADAAADMAKYGKLTAEELMKHIEEFGGFDKLKEELIKAF